MINRPYTKFDHSSTDMSSCAKRGGFGDSLLCPATIMSYGRAAGEDDDPRTVARKEPFYSSVRHKPNGWTIGVAGTSEVEKLFHETLPVVVRSGEVPYDPPSPLGSVSARWTGPDTVLFAWSERFDWRTAVSVELAGIEGSNDRYGWHWDRESNQNDPRPSEYSDPNVKPIRDADGSLVGVEVSALQPGARYRYRVDVDGATSYVYADIWYTNLPSEIFHLEPPERASGAPAAPSNVGARVTGPDSIRLHWRDNSPVETGYEVWYRKWSGEPDEVWRRYGERLPAGTPQLDVSGLAAEEEIRGRYSFVVVAYNDKGWNASETFHLEFMPGADLEATQAGEITDCSNRQTGIDLDGYQVLVCLETPDGARRRAWDYQLEADQSGLLYFFDRDNAEILVKVLDGCAINGHRWVFVAPVTTLAFKLSI